MSTENEFDPGKPHTIGAEDDADDLIGEQNLAADDDGDDDEPDELDTLRGQVNELQSKLEQQNQQWTSRMMQMMQNNQQAPQQVRDPYDMSDLPDPVEKPDDFKKALADRMKAADEAGYSRFQSQAEQQSRYTQLESRFNQTYADLADRPTLLQAAASAEAQAMRAQGLDPTQAVFNDSDGFLARVAERMRRELNVTTDGGETEKRGRSDRTRGVSAGSRKPGGAKRRGQSDEPTGFVDELKKTQLESGLI